MKLLDASRNWLFAMGIAVGLVGAAAVLADRQTREVAAQNPAPGAGHAEQLSKAFRHVAKDALPSIVSIETRGKPVQMTGNIQGLPFDENSPFGEMFKNDPRFRDMFKQFREAPRRQRPGPRGMGSGFIIDESGVIMTNSHVVRNAEEVKVRLQDGREYIASDIRMDPRTDVAVIRIDAPQGLTALPLGDSDEMQIGDWVLAVGSPFGLDLTVTAGIISAKDRGPGITERESFLQTDAAINPGNSGGPLLNLSGEVIGINTAISTRSGGYDGIGFAVPINMAEWVSRQLIEKGTVSRAYLGVSIQPVDQTLAEQFGTQVGKGVIVNQVMRDTPASRAGLEAGDVVIALDGKEVFSPRNLQGIVEQLDIGKTYKMTVLRDGKEKTLDFKAETMPEDFSRASILGRSNEEADAPEEQMFDELGLQVQELTGELAEQLGLEADEGVLVSSVENDSPASLAGIRAGDVIREVNRKKVRSPEEFAEAMEKASLEDGILMLVQTDRVSRFLSIRSR